MYPVLKRKAAYEIFIVALLFFFIAPVVPTSVSPFFLRPQRSPCGGILLAPKQVFTSNSYVIFGQAIAGTVHDGAFGLVYVPNNGWGHDPVPTVGILDISVVWLSPLPDAST